jgi:hypothetical protein
VTVRERPTDYLHIANWPLVVFLAYAAISLYPWIVFCIAAKKPVGSKNVYSNMEFGKQELTSAIPRHEGHMLAAETLQSVASVLTIPVTSTICSMAAVALGQR